MPRLSKQELLRRVERGLQAGGWSLLYLSPRGEHPARYRIRKDDISVTVRAYIWNISHGGGQRSSAEYRIQVTGLDPHRFVPERNGKTIILGYWDVEEVFAGFDYNFHSGTLGGSPSLQIGEQALLDANRNRFAVHEKGNGELAVAFAEDFIGTYINNLAELHATGNVAAEVDLLERLAEDPNAVSDDEIDETVQNQRQYAITQTRRALRALDFKDRVLTAYGHRCAMCGVQLRLLDGAHILPVSEPTSTDDTNNGVALCALHHRAYDRALVTFDENFRVLVNERQVRELRADDLHGKLEEFRAALGRVIHLPPARNDRPRPAYVRQANALRGWT